MLASFKSSVISGSLGPSKIGTTKRVPILLAIQPRYISRIWPTFIREGTPRGLRIISTEVPSSKKGISSSLRTLAITPLFPCRPAILSPTLIFLFCATLTLTDLITPEGNSSPFSRECTVTPTITPCSPGGSLREVFFTLLAFSPKIALKILSSGLSSPSPRGVTLPTRISPAFTSAPKRIIPVSSRLFNDSSLSPGISRVISSVATFNSRA